MLRYDTEDGHKILLIRISLMEYRDLLQSNERHRNRISELEARVEALTQDNRRLMGIDDESLGIKRDAHGVVIE